MNKLFIDKLTTKQSSVDTPVPVVTSVPVANLLGLKKHKPAIQVAVINEIPLENDENPIYVSNNISDVLLNRISLQDINEYEKIVNDMKEKHVPISVSNLLSGNKGKKSAPAIVEKIVEQIVEVPVELENPIQVEQLVNVETDKKGVSNESANSLKTELDQVKELENPIQVEQLVNVETDKKGVSNELANSLKTELDQVKELNNKYLNVINQLNDELLVIKATPKPKAVNNEETLLNQIDQLTQALNRQHAINRTLAIRLGYTL